MRVVYSDESGTGSVKEQPITVVAAVIFDMERQWEPVAADVKGILDALQPRDRRRLLFKGRELKGARLFKHLREIGAAANALGGLLNSLRTHRVRVFHGAAHRKKVEEQHRQAPQDLMLSPRLKDVAVDVAFRNCIDAVDRFIHETCPEERVIWIADMAGSHERTLDAKVPLLRYARAIDVFNKREQYHSYVLDTVYYGHSERSLALQLADVCAAVVMRHLLGDEGVVPFYGILREILVTHERDAGPPGR